MPKTQNLCACAPSRGTAGLGTAWQADARCTSWPVTRLASVTKRRVPWRPLFARLITLGYRGRVASWRSWGDQTGFRTQDRVLVYNLIQQIDRRGKRALSAGEEDDISMKVERPSYVEAGRRLDCTIHQLSKPGSEVLPWFPDRVEFASLLVTCSHLYFLPRLICPNLRRRGGARRIQCQSRKFVQPRLL